MCPRSKIIEVRLNDDRWVAVQLTEQKFLKILELGDIYVTKPVGKVLGEFEIEEILEDSPMAIWEKTKKYSGITKKDYIEYFEGNEIGFAISIKNTTIYQKPLELKELSPTIKSAPQSFMYI